MPNHPRPRVMLLTATALVTLRCSSGPSCPDGTPMHGFGFCAADDASSFDAMDQPDHQLWGFADVSSYDATDDGARD